VGNTFLYQARPLKSTQQEGISPTLVTAVTDWEFTPVRGEYLHQKNTCFRPKQAYTKRIT
jgi:hypothetical protein